MTGPQKGGRRYNQHNRQPRRGRKGKIMGYYDYRELRAAALASNATQADIDALGEWVHQYGQRYWNGEYFDANNGLRVYPVYRETEPDEYELTGYEIR